MHLGIAVGQNPGYLKLRKIRAAQSIARTVRRLLVVRWATHSLSPSLPPLSRSLQMAQSQNKMYLSGNSLMLNIQDSAFDDATEKLKGKK